MMAGERDPSQEVAEAVAAELRAQLYGDPGGVSKAAGGTARVSVFATLFDEVSEKIAALGERDRAQKAARAAWTQRVIDNPPAPKFDDFDPVAAQKAMVALNLARAAHEQAEQGSNGHSFDGGA